MSEQLGGWSSKESAAARLRATEQASIHLAARLRVKARGLGESYRAGFDRIAADIERLGRGEFDTLDP